MSLKTRLTWFVLIALPLFAVGVALISQHIFGMMPCAWCVIQRLILLSISLVAAIGFIWRQSPKVSRLFGAVIAGGSLFGVGSAFYQHMVAAESTTCMFGPATRFMSDIGLEAGIPWLFGIYANCADAAVSLFGVNYDVWAGICFGVLFIASLPLMIQKSSKNTFIFK